ncbi:PREDICTED: CISIN_1g003719mg [Prunus dulcis]|uniref:PREDICTED: CISIN_1g003719mg n=2 Tax=Prunus dulcis TaxID=3755 RepID=A0A5E4F3M9_PRUDU|nr:uncharacterized protein LOC117635236 [Prunus dulcis]VVA22426.1 PREDICTED: CISIN_1g003719mg [Prunus dulcis]
MDKPRDVRRGATRFKQPSGHKLFSCLAGVGAGAGGDFVQSAKSKKERLRKLSALGTASSSFQDCEMGCDVSDREDELPSKRFKLPKKFFDDCNGVDHASVPRKLRSAMKKRNRESASPSIPNSKKLNHAMSGIESRKRDGVNKPKPYLKQGGSDRSLRETVSGDITKDEEEVVETLYALAGLFPNNDANDNSKLDTESLDANPSALPESKETPTPAFEVGNDKSGSICPLKATEASSPSSVERLAKETDQVDSLNKSSTQSEPELPNSRKFCITSDDSVPHDLNISSVSAIVEECNEKPTANVVNFSVPSDLSLDSRKLKQPVQKESSIFGSKPETALELGKTMGSQVEVHNMVQESKKNGPVLWPGLSSNVSHGARNDSPSSSSQSPAAKIPAWLDAALSTSRASVQNVSSFGKVTNVLNGRRMWKKCAAHVYISHLIQALKNSESEDKLQPNEMRLHEGSKQVALLGANIYTKVKNGIVSASSIDISSAEKRPNEAKNGILEQKKLYQDQPQCAMGSRAYPSPKQSFDFLSLSAGGGGLETNDSFSRARNGMEPSSQSQVPYIHSLMQHHTLIPLSLPQSHFSPSSCPNNPSAAQQAQLQLPPYHVNPFCGPQASPTALTKQQPQQQHLQLQQQQQQQQRLWAAQLVAQYRPVGTTAPAVHFPSWQNGRQETMLIPCGQAVMSPSPSTVDLVGPKYAPLSQQQQQQLMAVTSSFPPGRVKRQDHHLPSVYEESGGGFRAGSALPLQLLCSERL